jgi:glyoxylase-like metal-dependent hydrolase (beta-lactamase superfamily II)
MNRFSVTVKKNGPVNLIHMTSRFLGLTLYKVHAFFVDGLLIDTGFTLGRNQLLKLLDTLHPDIVVNTHYHEDHTGNNFWIRKKYGLLPMAHHKTFSYLQDPSQWLPWYRRFVWGCPHPSEMGELDSKIKTQKFEFMIIPTPGHSDDHLCFFEPNERWLFSGDLFISEQVKYLREEEDIGALVNSLNRVVALRPKKMFCSFSGFIDQAEEAIHRKIDYFEYLKSGVEKGVQEGLSPREIQRRLLGREDLFSFVSSGHISKQNLIDAFLRSKGVEQ